LEQENIAYGKARVGRQLWKMKLSLWWKAVCTNTRLFREARIGMLGLVIIIAFGVFGAVYPWWIRQDISVYDPVVGFDDTITRHPSAPTLRHPLGTDMVGRDILSQMMSSTRVAFTMGLVAATFTASIATIVGAVAAYYGGFVDTVFMRTANILMLFPFLAFIPVLSAMMEITFLRFAVIIGLLSGFGGATLIVKSKALGVVNKPYIEAAKVAGGSNFHIIRRHVIPNILSLSFLYMMFSVQAAIFSEAILSWLGFLHIRMSWGIMLYSASRAGYLVGPQMTRYWWMWLPAGVGISLLCAAFYLVGRGLDPIVNPRLRRR